MNVLVSSEFEVVHRKNVVVVHNEVKVRCAHFSHETLYVVVLANFTVEFCPDFLQSGQISRGVFGTRKALLFDDEREDLFVPEHSAAAAASSLLQARKRSSWVVETDVHSPPPAVFRSFSSRDNRDVALVFFVLREELMKRFRDGIGVTVLRRPFEDTYRAFIAVDIHYNVFLRFARYRKGVKPGSLQEWPEVPSCIAVVRLLRKRRKEYRVKLAHARILRGAGKRPSGDDHRVFRVVPLAL